MTVLAAIPSPTQGVWQLGPLPIRAYALCIVAGIVAAVLLTEKRWVARGGAPGRRARHRRLGGAVRHRRRPDLPRDHQPPARTSARAATRCERFDIWEGGLGIWGAVALGGVGAWIACRRRGIPLPAFADAVAPGCSWRRRSAGSATGSTTSCTAAPTDLPWGLRDLRVERRPGGHGADGEPVLAGLYHPTFLYELLWNLGVAALVIWADRRFRLGHGRAFALYVTAYAPAGSGSRCCAPTRPRPFFGVRLNVFTSIVVGLLAVAYFVWQRGRPREVIDRGRTDEAAEVDGRDEQQTRDGGSVAAAPPLRPEEP